MSEKVQVAVAGDVAEAEEIQAILRSAGIETELETGHEDAVGIVVAAEDLAAAQEALEALTEPGELLGEP